MMEYGMHCMGCPFAMNESLEEATSAHGVSADELVEKLNDFFAENTL
jgi:hydroxylamine reductase